MSAKILAFAGSLRTESWNHKLVLIAAQAARKAGADVTAIRLADYPLPLMDEDLEKRDGPPANATKLKHLFFSHDALLLACPEYNSSITGVMKNTIDWVSRPAPGEKPLQAFDGKVALLVAASPGPLGGLRGLVTVRSILSNIKTLVLPEQVVVTKAHDAFNTDGTLKDAKQQAQIEAATLRLVELTTKLKGA